VLVATCMVTGTGKCRSRATPLSHTWLSVATELIKACDLAGQSEKGAGPCDSFVGKKLFATWL
jgi:hypothetical protein